MSAADPHRHRVRIALRIVVAGLALNTRSLLDALMLAFARSLHDFGSR
jgi:hypothetical protein